MQESLLYLNLFSALYYAVLICYLFFQRKKLFGSGSMIGIMAASFYSLVNNSVVLSGRGVQYSLLFFGAFLFVTLFGVFIRAHIYKLLHKKLKIDLLNVALVVLWIVAGYSAYSYYTLPSQSQAEYWQRILVQDFPSDFALLNDIFYLVMLLFLAETGYRVFQKPHHLDKKFSNLFVQSVKYVRLFWCMLIGLYVVVMTLRFFIEEFYVEYAVLPISFNVLYLFVVFNLRHYTTNYSFNGEVVENEKEEPSSELVDRIEIEAGKEENFRDPEFNLERLSKIMEVSKNKISAAINQGLGIGFNDLLNANRIEFSKNELRNFDEKRDTVEGIGYSCGFNSKASFYRAFKKFTSMTPSEFMRLKK